MKNLRNYIRLIRVKHWIKNFFVLAPPFFAATIFKWDVLQKALIAFFVFNVISSFVYVINDIWDKEGDKNHPEKKDRPIASGVIRVSSAIVLSVFLILIGGAGSLFLPLSFQIVVFLYVILNLFYTIYAKHVVILDTICIATGFVLRVVGGAFAILVNPTGWIIMTTFFLCLFLGFGKRRNEIIMLQTESTSHRKVLEHYDETQLNHLLMASGTISIISYSLFTLETTVVEKFNTDKLIFTVPFVTYGIFRYSYLLWQNKHGDPTDLLYSDKSLILCIILWLATTVFIIYPNWSVLL